ncbi:hypothetical protein WN944_009213 [Citrus x changshan-huyou]|uniref:Uncharacterized protein n=1 Tax=Citrus x changshan-huyou TaxID=2935761 RepID=A0AAP0MSL2_9ROSI
MASSAKSRPPSVGLTEQWFLKAAMIPVYGSRSPFLFVTIENEEEDFFFGREQVNNHPKIVKLRNLVKKHEDVFIVFEYMESDLLKLMKESAGQNFSEDEMGGVNLLELLPSASSDAISLILEPLHYRCGSFRTSFLLENRMMSNYVHVSTVRCKGLTMIAGPSTMPRASSLSGNWDNAAEMMAAMNQKGLKKVPGCSWVEGNAPNHLLQLIASSRPQSIGITEQWLLKASVILVCGFLGYLLYDKVAIIAHGSPWCVALVLLLRCPTSV